MLTFIFLNILIAYSAFLIVYKVLRITGKLDAVLALFVIYISQIIYIELILGVAHALYLKNIIILSIVLFLIIYFFTRDKRSSYAPVSLSPYFSKILSGKIYAFIFSVAFSFLLVKILVNLLNPPFGWDSLNYHFTFAVEWFKHGNLDIPPTVFDDPSPSYYPINGSLFYLWLILPFKSVFIADLGQLPFFIFAVLAVYNIARKVGLRKDFSFYSAALFALIPNFFKQLQIAYVDIMVAAFFLICLDCLLLMDKDFSFKNALIYSLSLGLLIGTKTVALPFSVLLIIPFIAIFLKNKGGFSLVLLLLLCILLWGGYSYLNNFFTTRNPLYPLDFKIFNIHIFKGVMERVVYSSHFQASDYQLEKALFHEGLGMQALLIILPGIFLALPVTLLKRKKELNFNFIYLSALPVLIYLVYRYVIPLANLRYLYALLGIGIILGFYLLSTLQIKKIFVNILVSICVLASISELAKRQELVAAILLSCLFFLALLGAKRINIPKNLFKKRYPAILFLTAIFCLFLMAEKYYKRNEFPRYYKMVKYSGFWPDATLAWDWLNSNTAGSNIAYAGRPVPFPLYGSGFKNNVFYVSVNKVDPVKLHFLKDSRYRWDASFENLHKNLEADGNYRANANYKTWLGNLYKRKTDYIFVYSLHQTKSIIFPIEDSWAKDHPGKFKNVFCNQTIRIYEILK